MYFTQVAILALAAVAQAAPAVSRNVTPLKGVTTFSRLPFAGDVSKDATFSVTLCSEQNFGGAASYTGSTGVCYNVPSNYNDVISSLRLDRTCTFWVDGGCNGNALVLNAGDYPQIDPDFNDKISAYACN